MNHFLAFLFLFVSTFASAEADTHFNQSCPSCLAIRAEKPGDYNESWEDVALPKLLNPDFNSLSDICADSKSKTPPMKFALIALKSHACDNEMSGSCLRATRDLSDPANSWISKNFATYHMRLNQVVAKDTNSKDDIVNKMSSPDYFKGIREHMTQEGVFMVVDTENCKFLGSIDDGRRSYPNASRFERLNQLNKNLHQLIANAHIDLSAPIPLAGDKNIPKEFSLNSVYQAVQKQTQTQILDGTPRFTSNNPEERYSEFVKYLSAKGPYSQKDLSSLKILLQKTGKTEGAALITAIEQIAKGKEIEFPPCFGFYEMWQQNGIGNSPTEKIISGYLIWQKRLQLGQFVAFPIKQSCSSAGPISFPASVP